MNYYTGGTEHRNPSDIDEFPYRKRYIGDAKVKEILKTIIDSEPEISYTKWVIPDGKIVFNGSKELYKTSDIVVKPSIKGHWDYDIIIDYYSEYARVNSKGYGEKYSPLDYWNNTKLHQRWNFNVANTLKDKREAIYKNITEARPAYATASKSLYQALIDLLDNKSTEVLILDIAAYGERAIAIAGLNNFLIKYDGIDPNYDLIKGHDELLMDLRCLSQNIINFIHVGIENFKSCYKYDIITYSPPPYNMELYSSNQETQTYMQYSNYNEYFTCFLVESIYKAMKYSRNNTIFSITALDRNVDKFPLKTLKEYRSNHTKIIYVETLLLTISCFGFSYYGAIGLSVGDKPAQVPWFVYKYTKEDNIIEYFDLLKEHYYDIWIIISRRILSLYVNNIITKSIFQKLSTYRKKDGYVISNFMENRRSSLLLELIRLQIQNYVIEMISQILGNKITINKISTILGRYLMMRSITATFDEPWLSCLFLDPVFPTNNTDISEINSYTIQNFVEQGIDIDIAYDIVLNNAYWFASYQCYGLSELYDTIAHYIVSLALSKVELYNNNNIVTGNKEAIKLFDKIPKASNVLKKDNTFYMDKTDLKYIRYKTLGAIGHQYTRTQERTKIIEKIFNQPIIDLYASYMNNQSEYYGSIYPDVEINSIGSAFCIKLISGAYLANPVDASIFVEKAVTNIIDDLNETKEDLCISMGFTVWLDTNPDFIKNFKQKNIKCDNVGLNLLSESTFVRAAYILNKQKFPSTINNKTNTNNNSLRENSISVGVLLSSKPDLMNFDYINELGEYILFN